MKHWLSVGNYHSADDHHGNTCDLMTHWHNAVVNVQPAGCLTSDDNRGQSCESIIEIDNQQMLGTYHHGPSFIELLSRYFCWAILDYIKPNCYNFGWKFGWYPPKPYLSIFHVKYIFLLSRTLPEHFSCQVFISAIAEPFENLLPHLAVVAINTWYFLIPQTEMISDNMVTFVSM